MKFSLWGLIVIVSALEITIADPLSKLHIETINVKIVPNPYFADWTAIIHPGGEKVSVKMSAKEDVPADMMMTLDFTHDGESIFTMDEVLCASLELSSVKAAIIKYGEPKGKFPIMCPIKAVDEMSLKEFIFPIDVLPPLEGLIHGLMSFQQPGKEPYVTITATAQITHDVPGVPKVPGFGR